MSRAYMLMPKKHLLQKISAVVDFSHIYELAKPLDCRNNRRPSSDPVVLPELVLIQHLFSICSFRQIM